jgi:hypothetical protein
MNDRDHLWPALTLDRWLSTYETLHRWAQIVGKTRLKLAPFENHWWHAALYTTTRGFTTSPMPYEHGTVEIEFNILGDALLAHTSEGDSHSVRLTEKSVATFYREYRELLRVIGVDVSLSATPNELTDATPFAEDHQHRTYDADAARRWFRALTQADVALKRFRGRFTGKSSPAHLWWGALDIACTRFSERAAPRYSGQVPNCPQHVMIEAYSRECISAGWWPGTAGTSVAEPAFYAYGYPQPNGFESATITPSAAYYDEAFGEWVLPYEAVRSAIDPQSMIGEFFESTYLAAAHGLGWDVDALRASSDGRV